MSVSVSARRKRTRLLRRRGALGGVAASSPTATQVKAAKSPSSLRTSRRRRFEASRVSAALVGGGEPSYLCGVCSIWHLQSLRFRPVVLGTEPLADHRPFPSLCLGEAPAPATPSCPGRLSHLSRRRRAFRPRRASAPSPGQAPVEACRS